MDELLPHLEFGAPLEEAETTILLMHGLGADGHDFADVAQILCRGAEPKKWRFVLPHAPQQPVTINMGMVMPAWYDIIELTHPRRANWDTVSAAAKQIEQLMAREKAEKLILAGFSQGAALALHVGLRNQDKVAGVLMMSGYLLASDEHPCPPKAADEFPIGLFHGTADDVVPVDAATDAVSSLEQSGYSPFLMTYDGLGHSLNEDELRNVFEWLTNA